MSYKGDIRVGKTLRFTFTTRRFSTGVPFTLAGTPSLAVYKDGSTTESTAGITLTADFDAKTGLNHVAIDTSADGTFYASGSDFSVVIAAGTVDSVSVVGETVGQFSVENRSPLMPTTAGRTLDVSTTGEAGLDFDNIKQASAPTTLTNITIPTVTTLANLPAITAGWLTATGIAAGAITAAKFATDAIDGNALAASAVTEIQSGLATASALATVQADTDNIQTRLPAALTVDGFLQCDLQMWRGIQPNALVSNRVDSRTGAIANGTIIAATFGNGAITATVIDTGAIDADALATDAVTEIQTGLATAAAVAAAQADLDDIQTRIPAALTVGGLMRSDAVALSGDTGAADNAESFFDGTGYAGTNNVIPTVTNVSGKVLGGGAGVILDVGVWAQDHTGQNLALRAETAGGTLLYGGVGTVTSPTVFDVYPDPATDSSPPQNNGALDRCIIVLSRFNRIQEWTGTILTSTYNSGTGRTVITLTADPTPFVPTTDDTVYVLATRAAGSTTGDWTTSEKNQIRQALGVAGTVAASSGTGTLDVLKGEVETFLVSFVAPSVTVSSPLTSTGHLTLYQGFRYAAAAGSAIVWESDNDGIAAYATAVWNFRLLREKDNGVEIQKVLAFVTNTPLTLRLELTEAETASLEGGLLYKYQIWPTIGTDDAPPLWNSSVEVLVPGP